MGDPAPPWQQNVGRYHIISPLGQGGMADVHLARLRGPAGFDKLVVIKQIRQQLADDPEMMSLFLDEGRIAARLSHPNVVQTYEAGRDGARYFLAMEFLDGQPLSRVRVQLEAAGVMPLAMHLRVLVEILAGLHYAHELTDYDGSALGLVHRDVAPQNVFVTYDGTVKVVDFGIAKAKCSVVETRAGLFRGKVTYMACEQARGERVDRRADIFAVGVMLWEAVTGKRPWTGFEAPTIVKCLVSGRFPAVREACPTVPEDLAAILDRALAPGRHDRYPTAAAFRADIEAHLERCGDRTRLRDLGELVQRHFADDRARIHALIEQQVRAVRTDAGETHLRWPERPRPEERPHVEERSTVPEPAVTRSRSDPSFISQTPESFSASAASPAGAPRRRRRRHWRPVIGGLAIASAVLVAGIVRSMFARSSHEPLAAAAATTPAAAALLAVTAPSAVPLPLDGGVAKRAGVDERPAGASASAHR